MKPGKYLRRLSQCINGHDDDHRAALDVDRRRVELVKSESWLGDDGDARSDDQPTPDISVHLFWAYGDLSMLERLSCNSFLSNGFSVRLWTYNHHISVPQGVELRDAGEIISEDLVFTYKNGSYAGFANLFRYAVLLKHGGLWADTDVICLTPVARFRKIADQAFFVTEATRNPDRVRVNNNLIYSPAGAAFDLLAIAYDIAASFPVDQLQWGDTGPRLLTGLCGLYPRLSPRLMEPSFGNPVEWWNCPAHLNSPDFSLPEGSFFLHCYNEMWRRAGVEKSGPFASDSLMHALVKKYDPE